MVVVRTLRDSDVFPLLTNVPEAYSDDLRPLRGIVGDAAVVGIARGTHGAAELTRLSHRIVRFLVSELGFRTLAIEASGAIVDGIDAWLRDGMGEIESIVADAHPWWRSPEFVAVLRWMRGYNRDHPDEPVRLVGLEISASDMDAQERHMARAVLQWVERTGHKVVYWSGSHSAVGHRRAVAWVPEDEGSPGSRNAGSLLREQLGPRYRSLGLTFHHGAIRWGGQIVPVPPAPADFTDAILDLPDSALHLLDLTGAQGTPEVAGTSLRLRLIGPRYDPGRPASMTGGPLREFFDAVLHTNTVSPSG
ncbi:erythromycin esterase family protein [Amycolatopsis sp. YIM 10]|uniref:erythromycin esterase family protein n=1 Tax=Amycolatopsis sp. YIM 10 TaxID=2653857 RepID=UPI0012A952F2|nr:erythromycin esterase family protein [Amycolatopsis sp. YIM 10]QFU85894.1 Erythromycin esterase [Amycolatopsis sp. YIM 10]